jgi:RNA polymerase sigma factor (sigma-70 family)
VAHSEPPSPESAHELALIKKVCAGDRAAADELFRGIAPLVTKISYRGCHDLLDELFLYLHKNSWHHLRSWSGASKFKSWISVVARNYCSKMLKDSGRTVSLEYQEEIRTNEDDPLRKMIRSENILEVLNAIEMLEQPRDRRAVRMFYIDELSVEETAAALSCTPEQFHLIRFRAVDRLRKLMKGAIADAGSSQR